MPDSPKSPVPHQVGVLLVVVGLLTGFVVALSVLSGDEQGRVNLLYLLFLFVFLPVTGLLLSVIFLFRRAGRGLAGWLLEIPFWPTSVRQEVRALAPGRGRKYWLFYQTQLATLGFGIGGLLAFLLLLLTTDISFVWRSTLLEAPDLLPVLELLALPWGFWSEAQPTLELLRLSQDYRLAMPELTAAELGQWWRYALAAQLTYTLLPRTLMAVTARSIYLRNRDGGSAIAGRRVLHINPLNRVPMRGHLAPLVTEIPVGYVLFNWAQLPSVYLDALVKVLGRPAESLSAGPLTAQNEGALTGLRGRQPLVLVKAWEPPMGELRDFLQDLTGRLGEPGLILPLDWDNQGQREVRGDHLSEWRRFGGTLAGWSVLQLPVSGGRLS